MKLEELLALADEHDCREYFDPLDPEFDMALVQMFKAAVEKDKPKIFIDEFVTPKTYRKCPSCGGSGVGVVRSGSGCTIMGRCSTCSGTGQLEVTR